MDVEKYDKAATSNVVQFNKVGDYIKGTLISVEESPRVDKYGKKNTIYRIKSKDGSFHRSDKETSAIDTTPTAIKEGEEYTMFLNGPAVDLMRKVVVGQKFKIQLTELRKSAKGQPATIRTVYPGLNQKDEPLMDTEWLKSQEEQSSEF